jgi:hypothetical protein
MPPLAKPAPISAALAGCQAREMTPAPRLLETRPSAIVFTGRFVRRTMNVLFTAYFNRGHVPRKCDRW